MRSSEPLRASQVVLTPPNQPTAPLDRTFRPATTPNRLRPHALRRPQWSLSLESLGCSDRPI